MNSPDHRSATALGLSVAALCLIIPLVSTPSMAEVEQETTDEFFEMSLEELQSITVISASKIEQSLHESPNAISVITSEDIRRAGALSIPEALRLAPGVYVAQLNGHQWTVTIGGFALNTFSNKLLVLIDGVSIYSPLQGGVRWGDLPVSIDEVERIEVIRGPGGVIYGANASNGVINIFTKSALGPPEMTLDLRGGSQGYRASSARSRFGREDGRFGATLSFSQSEDRGFDYHAGDGIYNPSESRIASSRIDLKINESTRLGIDGRYIDSDYTIPRESSRAYESIKGLENGIFRLSLDQQLESGIKWSLQAFHSQILLSDSAPESAWDVLEDSRVNDVEVQLVIPFEAYGSHRLISGGGYRRVDSRTGQLLTNTDAFTVANLFINDDWKINDKYALTVGLKWEDISLVDPTLQWRTALLYDPTPDHNLRVSVANSYRSPTLTEQYQLIIVPLPFPVTSPPWPPDVSPEILRLTGNPDLGPENVISCELEHRGLWFDRIGTDLSYSYKQYDDLVSLFVEDPGTFVPPFGGPFGTRFTYIGRGKATSHTVELGANIRISDRWKGMINYGHVEIDVTDDISFKGFEHNSPHDFGRVGLNFSGPCGLMADIAGLYCGSLQITNFEDTSAEPFDIDAYWRLDLRLARGFEMENGYLTLGVLGTNLGDEYHDEYVTFGSEFGPLQVRRSVYAFIEYEMR